MQHISPSHAAKVGLVWVVFPGLILFLACFGGGIFLIENLELDFGLPEPLVVIAGFLVVIAGFLLGLVLASLWWMLTVMRWRIWAFEKVSDPVELHAFAVAWYILHEKTDHGFGKFYEKLIFATPAQQTRWKELEGRLQDTQNFLIEERFIYYSGVKLLWWFVLLMAFALFGIWFAVKSPDNLKEVGIGLAFFAGAMVVLFIPTRLNDRFPIHKRLAALRKREVQLRISREGLSITQDRVGFVAWEEIAFVDLLKEDDKTIGAKLYLKDGSREEVDIEAWEWNISPSYLGRLILTAHKHFSKT